MSYFVPPNFNNAIKIYVSNSTGNDGNDGSINTPLQTLEYATSKLRDGMGDILLLKCGDDWGEEKINLSIGGDVNQWLYIGSYGEGNRPKVRNIHGYSPASTPKGYIVIDGIHARAGFDLHEGWHHIVLQDLFVTSLDPEYDLVALALLGNDSYRINNIRLYRCIIHGGHYQGIFAAGVDSWIIDECVIDSNARLNNSPMGHQVYMHGTCGPGIFSNNIVARGGGDGSVQIRCGSKIINNLNLRPSVGFLLGRSDYNPSDNSLVFNNIVLYNKDINSNDKIGFGFDIQSNNTIVKNNIVAFGTDASANQYGFLINKSDGDIIVRNIVYNWNYIAQPTDLANGVRIVDCPNIPVIFAYNDIQHISGGVLLSVPDNCRNINFRFNNYFTINPNNQFWYNINFESWMNLFGDRNSKFAVFNYKEPREIVKYLQFIGLLTDSNNYITSIDILMNKCIEMNKSNWDNKFMPTEINEYIRDGFNLLNSDLNRDGNININDYVEFMNKYAIKDIIIDMNNDRLLNINDYVEFNNIFRE